MKLHSISAGPNVLDKIASNSRWDRGEAPVQRWRDLAAGAEGLFSFTKEALETARRNELGEVDAATHEAIQLRIFPFLGALSGSLPAYPDDSPYVSEIRESAERRGRSVSECVVEYWLPEDITFGFNYFEMKPRTVPKQERPLDGPVFPDDEVESIGNWFSQEPFRPLVRQVHSLSLSQTRTDDTLGEKIETLMKGFELIDRYAAKNLTRSVPPSRDPQMEMSGGSRVMTPYDNLLTVFQMEIEHLQSIAAMASCVYNQGLAVNVSQRFLHGSISSPKIDH